VFTTARYWSYPKSDESSSQPQIPYFTIHFIFSRLPLGLPNNLLLSGFRDKKILISRTCAACTAHLELLKSNTLYIYVCVCVCVCVCS
jgi:hypothetical protein